VILASAGYPGSYPKGKAITIGDAPEGRVRRVTYQQDLTVCTDVVIFHAGTTVDGDTLVTSGGRVIAVSAHALTLQDALSKAYAGVDGIEFEGKTFRRDIAYRSALRIYRLLHTPDMSHQSTGCGERGGPSWSHIRTSRCFSRCRERTR
jgi:phosphoribosylamine-glycine ligase